MDIIAENIGPAKIMFIGEKPGVEEVRKGQPLVGVSGNEFNKMLTEAGLNRGDCAITNVAHEEIDKAAFYKVQDAKMLQRPQVMGKYPVDEVIEGLEALPEIVDKVQPNIIVPLGDIALWAITGKNGITKWRGSILEAEVAGKSYKILPTFNPAFILKNYPWRFIAVQDLKKVSIEKDFPEIRKPECEKHVPVSGDQALKLLEGIRGKPVAADIEVRAGQISCIGFATSKHYGFTIPLMSITSQDGNYWQDPADEIEITKKLADVLTDPDTEVIWHNGLFDCQIISFQWGFMPNHQHDTMIMQHVAFPGMKKSLDFISSLYCDYYCYWKDDGKEWDPRIHSEEQHWYYNIDDVLYTFECWEVLTKTIKVFRLEGPLSFQMRMFAPVLKMMLRGVRVDQEYKQWLSGILLRQMQSRSEWLAKALGHDINPKSSEQMKKLFYKDFKMQVVRDKKTGNPSVSDEALETIKKRQKLLTPLCNTIQEIRSLGVFKSTFADAKLSDDGRLRASFSIAGTETFRFTSSKNIFGGGANMQTLPKGAELKKFVKDMIDGTDIEMEGEALVHPDGRRVEIDEADPDTCVYELNSWLVEGDY